MLSPSVVFINLNTGISYELLMSLDQVITHNQGEGPEITEPFGRAKHGQAAVHRRIL